MKIPDIEMQPNEVWKLHFRVRHILGREINEKVLRRIIEERIREIKKIELLDVSPVIENSFYVIVKVVENPIKLVTVVAVIIAAGLAAGFLTVTFVGAEKIAPAVAYGMEIGIIIIAIAIAIVILSRIKK